MRCARVKQKLKAVTAKMQSNTLYANARDQASVKRIIEYAKTFSGRYPKTQEETKEFKNTSFEDDTQFCDCEKFMQKCIIASRDPSNEYALVTPIMDLSPKPVSEDSLVPGCIYYVQNRAASAILEINHVPKNFTSNAIGWWFCPLFDGYHVIAFTGDVKNNIITLEELTDTMVETWKKDVNNCTATCDFDKTWLAFAKLRIDICKNSALEYYQGYFTLFK